MQPRERLSVTSTSGEGPLIGRVRELQELRDAYAGARAGRGGVQLVLGDPGVGKTRLAAALAEHARADGARVVWTRGWGRAAPPYWPWVEVVRSLCPELDGETLRRELGDGADELLRLAPELAERLPDARPPSDRPADGEEASEIARFALFDALLSLLRLSATQAPVVVLIDDLQAVDEGSLVALDFVSRMLRDVAVLLVVTMHERVPERTRHAQAALSNIVRAGRRLVLGGLSSEDLGRLIAVTSGIEPHAELARAVHARTEGNVFFAREILALLLAEGRLEDPPDELPLPEGVRETIRRRLEPLDERAITTLEQAAILGRTFGLTALERASALDREGVLAALDRAAELGIVAELPATVGQYRFGHGLIGDTLLASMTRAQRMASHRAAGEALEHVYRGAIESHLAELAHHFLSAAPRGDLNKAVDYAQRAAHQALENLAYEQAADLFSRALEALELLSADVPRRAALLLGLGTAQSRAGRPAARATFDAAIAAARSIDDHETFARAALGAAPFALTPGFVDDAHVALLVEALERIGPQDDPLRVRLLGSLAVALYWSDNAPRRVALAHEALAMAQRLGDDVTHAFALSSAQLATSGPDGTEQGLEWLRTLFALTDRAGESVLSLDARSRHIDLLLELDDVSGADMAIETAERLARAAGDRRAMAFVPIQRARRVTMEARFDDARALLQSVVAASEEMPATTIPLTVGSQLVVLDWLQLGTREIGDSVRGYADSVPAMPVWRAALAAALAAAGRHAEAQLEFDRLAANDYAALPRDNLWFAAIVSLVEAAVALDLPERSLELYDKLAPFAGRNVVTPTAAFLGSVEMWLGITARAGGRPERALEHLARARTSAMRSGLRLSLLRIAVEEGATLLRLGGDAARGRARELIARTQEECEQIGLTSLTELIAPLLAELQPGAAEIGAGSGPGEASGSAEPGGVPGAGGEAAGGAGLVAASVGAKPGGAKPGGAEPGGAEPGGAKPGGAKPGDATPGSATPGSATPGSATLRRVGDVWTIDDGRTTLYLNDGRGVRLLALLLERPGQEVHSLDLVAIVDGTAPAPRAAQSGEGQTTGRSGVQGGAGPRLDEQAKGAYRARIAELRAEIAEAQTRGDTARAQRAQSELDFVGRELELAVGIGGRDRQTGSHAERARVNVTRAIRSTLKRIAGYDARLGRELDAAIRTGTFCSYVPDPRRPLRWTIEDPGRGG